MTRKKQPEFDLQRAVAQYLNLKYPNVLYQFETLSWVHLTIPQRMRIKPFHCQAGKLPDLMIYAPCSGFVGLAIEFKAATPFKKDGAVKAAYAEQAATLDKLAVAGWSAHFAWEFDQAQQIIDGYLS